MCEIHNFATTTDSNVPSNNNKNHSPLTADDCSSAVGSLGVVLANYDALRIKENRNYYDLTNKKQKNDKKLFIETFHEPAASASSAPARGDRPPLRRRDCPLHLHPHLRLALSGA